MNKRWFWAVVFVAIFGAAVVALVGGNKEVTVDTVTLSPQRVEQTVCCTGVVESATSTGVFVPVSCRIQEVAVAVGQRVSAGDTLAVIDKQASLEQIADEKQRMVLAATPDTLLAPADGVVVATKVESGDWLEPGVPCVVVALQDKLQVRIAIQEKDLPAMRIGMPVRVTGEGFRQSSYAGTLQEIAASARTDSGAGTVVEGIVALQGDDPSLRLGLSAKATIVTDVTDKGLLIPYEAVENEGEDSFVYLLKEGAVKRVSVPSHIPVGEGLLLADKGWQGSQVIVHPEQIAQHKLTVKTEGAR